MGIKLERITKVYDGGVLAVDDLSLEVAPGEFMVLVGPSGCGKSTMLRMIAGLEEVTRGRIEIGGTDVTTRDPSDRDIAMVFQNYALYPHMTVRDNLAFGLRQRKTDRAEIARRVDEAARMLGLGDLLRRKPAALSGGQKQRVAMGRALVREPRAFLMDEPLSNLDAKLRASMRGELSRLHDRLGVTTVYVTHDQVEAMTLGERVAVLRDGVLQQCDVPQRLFEAPANLFVAAFIGSPAMNLVEATIDGGVVRFGGLEVPLPPGTTVRAPGRPVILGVRPTDFELSGPLVDPAWPRISVHVDVVEQLGSESHVQFALDAPRVVADAVRAAADAEEEGEDRLLADDERTRFTARVSGRRPVESGTTVELAVDAGQLHFFDIETGEALDGRGQSSPSTARALSR
jgi:multiple sugar transport system ATP-binding protein